MRLTVASRLWHFGFARWCWWSPWNFLLQRWRVHVSRWIPRGPVDVCWCMLMYVDVWIWLVVWNMFHFSIYWDIGNGGSEMFGTFFIFPYIGNRNPNWLIFFRGVEITINPTARPDGWTRTSSRTDPSTRRHLEDLPVAGRFFPQNVSSFFGRVQSSKEV